MRVDVQRLLEDVADTLVGSGQGGRFGQGREGAHGSQALGDARPFGHVPGVDRGIDLGRGKPAVAQVPLEALDQELVECDALVLQQPGRESRETGPGQAVKWQRQGALDQHAHHPQRMAAQCERVLVAGGQVADAEHADQRFELVCQRHNHASGIARQFVPRETRLVVVFNRPRDRVTESVMAGIVAAHDSLQLRELPHHIGQKIGLGQSRRSVRRKRELLSPQLLPDHPCNRAHALRAFTLGAQFVVVDHLVERRRARFERLASILVEKELRVGQPRTHHSFISIDDGAGVGRADVADYQEPVGQLAAGVEQREIFLVGLHRQDQAFLRDFEVLLFEGAREHIRPLDQRRDFVQQRRIGLHPHRAAEANTCQIELADDFCTAFAEARNDGAVARQHGGIAIGVREYHRRRARLEAMPQCAPAGLQAQRMHGHHLGAVERHQAMGRTHKTNAAPARKRTSGLQLVSHDLRNRQLGDRVGQGALQAFGERCTFGHAVQEQGFDLAVHGPAQARQHRRVGTNGQQLLLQGGRGGPRGVETDAHGHQFLRLRLVCGTGRDIAHMYRQAPRRSKGGMAGLAGDEAVFQQAPRQCAAERVAQGFERFGRQFLDQQFHQQVVGCHCCSVSAAHRGTFALRAAVRAGLGAARRGAHQASSPYWRDVELPRGRVVHGAHAAFFVICSTHSRGAWGKPSRSRLSK